MDVVVVIVVVVEGSVAVLGAADGENTGIRFIALISWKSVRGVGSSCTRNLTLDSVGTVDETSLSCSTSVVMSRGLCVKAARAICFPLIRSWSEMFRCCRISLRLNPPDCFSRAFKSAAPVLPCSPDDPPSSSFRLACE